MCYYLNLIWTFIFTLAQNHNTLYIAVLGSGAQVLSEPTGASVRSGQGCPILETAGSSSSNPPTARLSPAATMVAPWGKLG